MKVEELTLFSVNGFHGNENLGYMCIQASSAAIYHIGIVPGPSSNPPLRLYGCVLPAHLQSTIYPTPPDVTVEQSRRSSKREMLSIAVEISSDDDIKVSEQTTATLNRDFESENRKLQRTKLVLFAENQGIDRRRVGHIAV